MTELPQIQSGTTRSSDSSAGRLQDPPNSISAVREKIQRLAVHILRASVFVAILCMIRFAHRQSESFDDDLRANSRASKLVADSFSPTAKLAPLVSTDDSPIDSQIDSRVGGYSIVDEFDNLLGYVIQTSPSSDHIIGYSGPTNCLISFDLENRIRSIGVLQSGDTIEHVDAVNKDSEFFKAFEGFGFENEQQQGDPKWASIDGVSGATLTSYAIIASVANRVSGSAPSLKFDLTPKLETVKHLFSDASKIEAVDEKSRPTKMIWNVLDVAGQRMGFVTTTTPAADSISGYQGPTATISAFDLNERLIGLAVDQTYENQPYANYLNDDYPFQKIYAKKTLDEISEMDPETLGIEGVSGATMTSVAVAKGLQVAAASAIAPAVNSEFKKSTFNRNWISYWPDVLTVLLAFAGVLFSFTHLSGKKTVRRIYQIFVILFLGFINGHIISQAMLVGWAANSVPLQVAPGLIILTAAALLIPLFSKHQPYCQHICPFGAIQQVTRNRVGVKLKIPKTLRRVLEWVPFLLLVFIVFVGVSSFAFNLASLEPFDAFAFRVAGWATIGVFTVGLVFSLVSPMAYCRYGCPTGAAIDFLRYRADSHQLGFRDLAALGLLCIAVFGNFV